MGDTVFDDVNWCPIHGLDLVDGRCAECQPTRPRKRQADARMQVEVVTKPALPRHPWWPDVLKGLGLAMLVAMAVTIGIILGVVACVVVTIGAVKQERARRGHATTQGAK